MKLWAWISVMTSMEIICIWVRDTQHEVVQGGEGDVDASSKCFAECRRLSSGSAVKPFRRARFVRVPPPRLFPVLCVVVVAVFAQHTHIGRRSPLLRSESSFPIFTAQRRWCVSLIRRDSECQTLPSSLLSSLFLKNAQVNCQIPEKFFSESRSVEATYERER